ncbi:AAA family ATPase [Clostridium sp. 1001275B_160808_H3]|uniref:AAA family ATPase n=1 Tax=Clostridium sp. 1001275B_160808_H3 TaxID=2787110 RepID=UPI00189ABE93|nr:AAA family ATPase [Clostridium sp. 1001275B_160808_H3]
MNKKLIIVNGAMGVGKTTTCKELNKSLQNSVLLDGDWCWMMNPFVVNEENKKMVIDNITYLLRGFIRNSTIEYVIFTWVIHREEIYNNILEPLKDLDFEVIKLTLTCSKDTLRNRVLRDVKLNLRTEESINRSIEYLDLYKNMDTKEIDTTDLSILEVVELITNNIINHIKK